MTFKEPLEHGGLESGGQPRQQPAAPDTKPPHPMDLAGHRTRGLEAELRDAWAKLADGRRGEAAERLDALKGEGAIIEYWSLGDKSKHVYPVTPPEPGMVMETPLTSDGMRFLAGVVSRIHDVEEEFGIFTYRDSLDVSSPGKFAANELATNVWKHAQQGILVMHYLDDEAGQRKGFRLVCMDQGPGVKDAKKALEFGDSTSGTRGLGLPYLARKDQLYTHNFKLETAAGKGTMVSVDVYR